MEEKRPLRRQPDDHHFWSLITAFSVTRTAGPTGAIVSCSATTSRMGQRMSAARRTGRRQEKLSSDRAATRLRHSVESFGVMSFSPKWASSVATNGQLSGPTSARQVSRGAAEDRTEAV